MRMSDPVVVVIGHPDGTEGVQLSVFGRERPSTDTDDVNWLHAGINAQVGGFSAAIPTNLRAEELVSFRSALEQLYADIEGEATFDTMEGSLRLELVGDGLGHLKVIGRLRDYGGDNELRFFCISIVRTCRPLWTSAAGDRGLLANRGKCITDADRRSRKHADGQYVVVPTADILAEGRGRWVLPIIGGEVTQVQIDYAFGFVVVTYGDDPASVRIRIEAEFKVQLEGVTLTFDPEDTADLGRLVTLHKAVVEEAYVVKEGHLVVRFADGRAIEVAPHGQYEAWTVSGDLNRSNQDSPSSRSRLVE